ncbi:hypothetical protein NXY03_12665 [Bacteroides fragilis]|nr:hypothetical protein NXY03_12665 [Bacteroides fragilis]
MIRAHSSLEVTFTVCPVPAFTSDKEDLFTERADAPAAHLNWHLTIFPARVSHVNLLVS